MYKCEFDILLLFESREESRALGVSGLPSSTEPSVNNEFEGRLVVYSRWNSVGVPSPSVLLSSVIDGLTVLFMPRRTHQTSTDSELLFFCLQQSGTSINSLGIDRSPDWFRLLFNCLGRHAPPS